MSGAKDPLQTELQFLLVRGEIHVMTGLNKDKDKDKRSGEARVSDVLTASLSFYTLQIFLMGLHLQMLVIGGIITVSIWFPS